MNRGAEKRSRREGHEPRVSNYEATMVALRKTKIGPAFPEFNPEALVGMRGVERRKTKRPFWIIRRMRGGRANR